MAEQIIYVDAGVTPNPGTGAGTPGNPYNNIGQCSQAGTTDDVTIMLAAGQQSDAVINYRITSGSQNGKIKMRSWEQNDGRTGPAIITNCRLVTGTWTRGKLTVVDAYSMSWSADPAGDVWRFTAPEMSESNQFQGTKQPEAGYPYGRNMRRRKLNNGSSDNAPNRPYQVPDTNGDWGVASGGEVVVYSDSGISPGSRYGQWYVRYQPYVDATTNGSRLIDVRPFGGLDCQGIKFRNVDAVFYPRSRTGANSAPIDGVIIADCDFELVRRACQATGADAGDYANSDAYLGATAGFVNFKFLRNRGRHIKQNMLMFGSAPAMNNAMVMGNVVCGVGETYSDGCFYMDGQVHTTDGSWIKVWWNYIEAMPDGMIWPVDGCPLYSEDGSSSVWFRHNMVIDCAYGVVFNGPRRRGRCNRNWFLNRAPYSPTYAGSAICAVRVQGGYGYQQWLDGAEAAKTINLVEVNENVFWNIGAVIDSGPTGWSAGAPFKCEVKHNYAGAQTGSSATGRDLIKANGSNAASFYDVEGNVLFNMDPNPWSYNYGAGTIANSNMKNSTTQDFSARVNAILNALPDQDTIIATETNPVLSLMPEGPPKAALSRKSLLVSPA